MTYVIVSFFYFAAILIVPALEYSLWKKISGCKDLSVMQLLYIAFVALISNVMIIYLKFKMGYAEITLPFHIAQFKVEFLIRDIIAWTDFSLFAFPFACASIIFLFGLFSKLSFSELLKWIFIGFSLNLTVFYCWRKLNENH